MLHGSGRARDLDALGGKVFTSYDIIEQVFLYGEYELLRIDIIDPSSKEITSVNATGFPIGGGFRQMLGQRSSFSIMILWDVVEDPNYPYANPIIRGGFSIGL